MFNDILRLVIVYFFLTRPVQGSPLVNITKIENVARLAKTEQMLKYMNTSVDPCDDFYQYTCGNYAKLNPFNVYSPLAVNPLSAMNLAMEAKIKKELEIVTETDTDYDRQVKNFYRSCVAMPELKNVFADKLKHLIREFGQMPAVEADNWEDSNFSWWKIVAKIAYKTNMWFIIEAGLTPSLNDKTKIYGVLGQAKFRLERKSYYVDEVMKLLHDKLIQHDASILHNFLGINKELANRTAHEMLEFEIALAHGLPDVQQSNEHWNVANIDDFQKKYLSVWDTKQFYSMSLNATLSFVYVNDKYLDNVIKVLNNTPKRVIANYIFYSYISKFIFDPTKSSLPLEDYCVRITRDNFHKYLDNLMYRQHFSEEMKDGIYSIWQNLQSSFEEVLQSPRLDWIRNSTRKLALEKLKAMKLQIKSYEDIDFSEDFKHLSLSNNDFLHNMKSLYTLRGNQARTKTGTTQLDEDSTFTPQYKYTTNCIQIPVAFLMPYHFWSKAFPYAYNFANMGFYIAHEILHGFDDLGRYYDAEGRRQGWWDLNSFQEFEKRKNCFIEQYSQYEVNGKLWGERTTQAENIADNGGLRLAYVAYIKWLTKASLNSQHTLDMESLPGLDFTYKQLFFISYGQLWCSNVNAIFQSLHTTHVHHMPHTYRVMGPLSNFDAFSQEFNCPQDSKMNRSIKCEIY